MVESLSVAILQLRGPMYLVLLFALVACEQDESIRPLFSTANNTIVQGYYALDTQGTLIYIAGHPNVNLICEELNSELITFPNPADDVIMIFIRNYEQEELRFQLVGASLPEDATFASNTIASVSGESYDFEVSTYVEDGNTSANLDLSGVPSGAYRLYVQLEDCLLYNNVIVY